MSEVLIEIASVDRTTDVSPDSFSIDKELNYKTDNMSFDIVTGSAPIVGSEIVVYSPTTDVKEFGGIIDNVRDKQYKPNHYIYECSARDYAYQADRKLVNEVYGDELLPSNLMQMFTSEWTASLDGKYLITITTQSTYGFLSVSMPLEQNLLSEEQSSIETAVSEFSAINATLSLYTGTAWTGSNCMKIVTNGLGSANIYADRENVDRLNVGDDYTASIYMRSAVYPSEKPHIRLWMCEIDSRGFIQGLTRSDPTILGYSWQRIEATHTIQNVKSSGLRLLVEIIESASISLYADGLQIEKGSSAGTWVLGGQWQYNNLYTVYPGGSQEFIISNNLVTLIPSSSYAPRVVSVSQLFTASDVFKHIVQRYCPGFTYNNVLSGSPVVDTLYFGYKRPSECFTQLGQYVGWDWYVDYDKAFHFFPSTSLGISSPVIVTSTNAIRLSYQIDREYLRNRTYIVGGACLS